jgi:hypothetical protein
MNTPFDTQTIRIDLQNDLQQAEQDFTQAPTIKKLSLINWITKKLAFLNSPEYQERKRKAQS